MIQKINEKRQKRANLITEMRGYLDKIQAEKRDLTSEEAQQVGRIEGDISKLDDEIRNLETQLNLEKRFANTQSKPVDQPEKRDNPFATEEYRSAFWAKMRGLDYDARALAAGSADKGANLVPTTFLNELLKEIRTFGVMRQLCTVRQLDSTTEIPTVTGNTVATWAGEAEQYTETDATFGKKSLGAFKLVALTKASEELLSDSAIDVEAFLAADLGEAFAKAEDTAFLSEARVHASKSPDSILANLTEVETSAVGAITFDDLIELYHTVKAPYRGNSAWLFSDVTAKHLRKLKDDNKQYIWVPGVQAGQSDTIFGKPVNYSDVMTFEAGKAAVVFGDFKRIWLADRGQMAMKRLNELYATSGQVGFIANRRLDAVLTIASAMAKLTVKSA